jgi:uncharacterized membrane protein
MTMRFSLRIHVALRRLLDLLALPVLLILATSLFLQPVHAATEKSVVWNRYDVTLDLRGDGSFHVTERQEIDFIGGPFTGGFADIPLGHIDAIQNLVVSEETDSAVQALTYVPWDEYEGDPGTYSATTTSSEVSVRYGFSRTSNESRVFILEYDVVGALRVYLENDPPNQQIWWTAIGSEVTEVAPVRDATMTIMLPTAISDLSQTIVAGPGGTEPAAHTTDGQTWTWEATDLSDGDSLEVRLQFPPIVNAAEPTWQQQDDAQRKSEEEKDERNAVLNVIFLGIGLLSLALGGVGLYGLWYTRGRDPHAGLVADFIPAPPDDSPPGVADALIDEQAGDREITATLVDLANRGVLTMEESTAPGAFGYGSSTDFKLTLKSTDLPVAPFETELIKSLFGSARKAGETVMLSSVKSRFLSAAPAIKEKLYQELVTRGYFTHSPEATRTRYRTFGQVGAIGIALLGCAIASQINDVPGFFYFLIGVLVLLALGLWLLGGAMPRKTSAGAEAAAKWSAFKKYLDEIEKYEKVEESQKIFEKYLPYATAFGLEHSWVTKFARVGASTPGWYGPVIIGDPFGQGQHRPRRHGRTTWDGPVIGGPGGFPGSGDGGRDDDGSGFPDLQDASDRAGKTLQGSSDSLLDMLNTAGKVFRGFGGGGGGGGWGGGGGFGGGGSSGGSSGGGGRGFS